MLKKLFSFALFPLLVAFSFVTPTDAVKKSSLFPLDEIEQYTIRVAPNDDATLEMDYHFKWKVLDSSSEGPLSWVKIGVPNCYVSNLKANTDNISKIEYSSDDGAFINVTFRNNHYAGEVIDFDFSFHQERIYALTDGQVTYSFRPGWFPEIQVKSLEVYWPIDKVTYENSSSVSLSETYYVWSKSLSFNETINVNVSYPEAAFPNKDLNKQYSSDTETLLDKLTPFLIVGGIVVFFVVLALIVRRLKGDGYFAYRGYSGAHYHFWFFHNFFHRGFNHFGHHLSPPPSITNSDSFGHGGHFGGGGCACACACACAGGGRAGCARKDFYQAGTVELLDKELRKGKETDKR
jgi:hypothetical protein